MKPRTINRLFLAAVCTVALMPHPRAQADVRLPQIISVAPLPFWTSLTFFRSEPKVSLILLAPSFLSESQPNYAAANGVDFSALAGLGGDSSTNFSPMMLPEDRKPRHAIAAVLDPGSLRAVGSSEPEALPFQTHISGVGSTIPAYSTGFGLVSDNTSATTLESPKSEAIAAAIDHSARYAGEPESATSINSKTQTSAIQPSQPANSTAAFSAPAFSATLPSPKPPTSQTLATQTAGPSAPDAITAVVTHTLADSSSGDWSAATWTNGAPTSTSIGDIAFYNKSSSSNSPATTSLDVNVSLGQIRQNGSGGSATKSAWSITSGAGAFTLDNTAGTANPFSGTNAFIGTTNIANLTVAPAIIIANTALTIGSTSTGAVTVTGGITGTGNLFVADSSTATITISTGVINNIGTLTIGKSDASTSQSGTGAINISSNIGSNVGNISLAAAGTTTLSGSVNNTGTITNTGSSSNDAILSGGVGSNVTAITENSATSDLIIQSNALTVNASGTTLTNSNASGSSLLTLSGGATGTGNLILRNNSAIANGITLSTTSVNNTGTISNTGSGTGNSLISAGVGSSVTGITENSTTSALTVSGVLTVASGGTTLTNNNASGSSLLTLSAGVGGTGNLILKNNSTIANGITLSTTTVNNTGTITNSGTGSGATLISAAIGSSVTGVTENSSTSKLILSGSNGSFASGLNVTSGTVQASGANTNVFGTGTVTIGSSGILDINGTNQSTGLLSGVAGASVTNSVAAVKTLTLSGAGSQTFAGVIGGGGNLALTLSSGTQVLSGTNTYTGGTNINGGVLALGTGVQALGGTGTVASVGTIKFGSGGIGGTLQFSASNTVDYSGRFSGAASQAFNIDTNNQAVAFNSLLASSGGTLTKIGLGTLTLNSGSSSYSGVTTVRTGTLTAGASSLVSANGAFGNAASAILLTDASSGASDNVSLLINGAFTVSRDITVQNNATSGVTTIGGSNATSTVATFSGTELLSKAVTLGALTAGATTDFTGLINDGAGSFAVSTSGAGIVKLSRAAGNTYDGGTTVGATNTLSIANTSGSATGTGAVSLTAGAKLVGASGSSVSGQVNLNGSNDISSSAGTMTIGSLNVTGTGNLLSSGAVAGNATQNGSSALAVNGTLNGSDTIASGATLSGTGTVSGTTGVTSGTINGSGLTLTGLTTFNSTGNILSGTETATAGVTLAAGAAVTQTGTLTGNLNTTNTGTFTANGAVTGNATVASGGTLAGSGSIGGTTGVTSGTINGSGLTLTGLTTFNGLGNILLGTETATAGVSLASGAGLTQSSGTLTGNITQGTSSALTVNGSVSGSDTMGTSATLSGIGTIGSVSLAGSNTISSTGTLTTSGLTVNGTGNSISGGTITGGSTINSGAFLNVNLGATLSGTTNVAGTLTGTGTLGTLNINSGGKLSPGNSPGTINSGATAYNSGGTYVWEINNATGAAGTGFDWNNITGTLTINATSGTPFTIDINGLNGASPGLIANFNKYGTYDWTIATASSGISLFAANKFTLDLADFTNVYTGTASNGAFSITTIGNDLVIHYTGATDASPGTAYWTGDVAGAPGTVWSTNTAGNTNWATDASGLTDTAAVPGSTSNVFFTADNGTNLTNTLGADFTINSLTFTGTGTPATAGVTIGGNTLTLDASGGNGITVQTGSGANTINSAVALGASQTWTNNSVNSLTVGGAISGGFGLTTAGSGTIVFSGSSANSYSGLTTVSAGELDLNKSSGVAVAGNLAVAGGTAKLLGSDQIATGSSVTVSGGTLAMQGFNNTVAGVQLASGSITGSGGVLTSSSNFDVRSGSASAILGGGVGLDKTTGGVVTLTGGNTYTGATVIDAGTLELARSGGPALIGTSDITVNNGGTLLMAAANQLTQPSPPTMTLAGGKLNAGGFSQGTGVPGTGAIGIGALTLTSNSVIDLLSTSLLHFANSNGSWTGTLSIWNWDGTPVVGGGSEQILFGSDMTGLGATQLTQISFYSDGGSNLLSSYAMILASGEIVPGVMTPVPEPSTWVAGALALLAVGYTQFRRFGWRRAVAIS